MPRTNIALQEVTKAAVGDQDVAVVAADAANGMKFINDGRTVLYVENRDAATKTVTLVSIADGPLGRTGDKAYVVPALAAGHNGTALIMPPQQGFNQTDGYAYVDFSAATNLFVAVVRFL